MARTAAQRAATARLVAMNRKRRNGGRSRSGGGGGGFRRSRRATGHTYGLTSAGGALVTGYGYLAGPRAALRNGIANKDPAGFLYNIRQSTPILGNDPAVAENRALVGTGVGIWLGGKILKRVLPFTHRTKVKVDRKVRVALT